MSLVKEEILQGIHSQLLQSMPPVLHEQWFAEAEILSLGEDCLELGVKNRFFKSRIETKYMDLLRDAACAAAGRPVSVVVSVSPRLFAHFREAQEKEKAAAAALELPHSSFAPPPPPVDAPRPLRWSGMELNPDLTFDSLIIGASNRLSHAVALRAVESPGEFSRIYFCGQHGVGKTHILQALCHEARRCRPDAVVVYVTCERFVGDFGAAHTGGKVNEFRKRYRNCDILVMDQLQALGQGSKSASQAELLSIIDHLDAMGKQTVFGATLAPDELEGVDPKLRDRLGAGFVDRLSLPDATMRAEIIAQKMAARGVTLPEAALQFLARELSGNVRKLEGTVNRLAALIAIEGMEPTTSCIRMALDVSTPGAKKAVLKCGDIIEAVSDEYGLTVAAVTGRGRSGPVRMARQVALVLCRRLLGARYAELGIIFDNRSHATVMSAIKKTPASLFTSTLEGRPVERILFRLGVNMKPEDIMERQGILF